MAKGKNKSKKKNKNNKSHENLGVIIIGLGIFTVLSVYTGAVGIVGDYVGRFLKGLFGILSYLVSPLIILMGILIIMSYSKKKNKTKIFLTILSVILAFLLVHLIYIDNFKTDSFKIFVIDSYEKGILNKGAGAFVSPLSFLIYLLFDKIGSYLIIIVLLILDILLLTNLSLKQIGNDVFNSIEVRKKSRKTKEKKVKKRKKAFEGDTIEFKGESSEDSLEYLDDTFNSIDSSEKGLDDEDIEIIDYSIGNQNQIIKDEKSDEVKSIDESDYAEELDIDISSGDRFFYSPPPIDLLIEPYSNKNLRSDEEEIRNNAQLLEETLANFGITAKVLQISKGPTITRYELQPAPGVKVSRIVSLTDDIALNLAATGVRIEAPIPGKAAIGVEIPNQDISPVYLREVLESKEFASKTSKLVFGLGKDVAGKPVVADISRMPHLLIAGATGSGKSVCINSLIISILYNASPDEVKLILIDPKVVELNHFNGVPHLLVPVVTDPKKAAGALNWAVQEMVSRYKIFADNGVKDISNYNSMSEDEDFEKLPQIIVIVDELADLMMVAPNEVEDAICRLAQMARAAGIHLVVATQRPSVDVITGLIKANIPSRIAFAVSSNTDSRTILDMAGAEKLLGRGDMLFYPMGSNKPRRIQGSFVSEKEINKIVAHIKESNQPMDYDVDIVEEIIERKDNVDRYEADELLPDAIEIAVDMGQISISMLQRRLRIGYSRAARIVDEMEDRGIVSGYDGSKPRNVLISKEDYLENYSDQI